jgi:hypothetical protein
VTDDQPDPVADGQSGGDIEYDLAHEALLESAPMSDENEVRHATVLPEMPTDSGDYSYDLAHDIRDRKVSSCAYYSNAAAVPEREVP